MNLFLRWFAILLGTISLWTAFTDNSMVWPVRNTVEYQLVRAWWKVVGEPDRSRTGHVAGWVRSADGQSITDAIVAVSEWDGRIRTIGTDKNGYFNISDLPVGFYRLAVTAPGYASAQTGGVLRGVTIRPGQTAEAKFNLTPINRAALPPLPPPRRSDQQTLSCSTPVPGAALRETLLFDAGDGNKKELIFLYRPEALTEKSLPVLLTVYPGPVDTWECVSIGLSQAGYAVLAIGPAYGLELTPDVDRLEQLVSLVKREGLAGADPARVAALGGSYSALLLELLMLRDPGLNAVVLLGPPTDMFDFRRRYEREGFIPPFGLDRALVALGLPSREPLRYLHHSMVYHTRAGLPATVIFHSYQDDIVPYQQSGLLADSLRQKGVESELYLFDGASHYLLEDSDASQAIYLRTLDFLSRHGMAPFPGKGR